MPELSRFFGIVVTMNFRDHPPPHFHARYGDDQVAIDIRRSCLLAGTMSPRALRLVLEWSGLHQHELLAAWDRARGGQPVEPIQPLE